MSERLSIEFEWLDLETGSEIDRAFAASIGLAVGDRYLTRIDDLRAKTVRNQMRGSAWHVAAWFAANWWRLRWEPEAPRWWKDVEWRIAHSVASAGGGYVWPNAIFVSDGDSMEIAMSPKSHGARFEPIRYINHIHARITAVEFEQRVDEFMDGVLSRLDSLEVKEKNLANLWAEILGERHDAETAKRRKLEAMAGYDPDQAPNNLLQQLLREQEHLGRGALEEVAAEARHETGKVLKPILALSASRAAPQAGGFRAIIPQLDASRLGTASGPHPWQKATKLAELARKKWGLGSGPISNQKFADLLAAPANIFTDPSVVPTDMPVALRAGIDGTYDIYFHRPRLTTRRFAISRLIGDCLYFANQEKLRPATRSKTSRQKFQRAFAQEFLCPVAALMDQLQTAEPDDDDISEAAGYFEVSPLMIRTTLFNKGKLVREALSWTD